MSDTYVISDTHFNHARMYTFLRPDGSPVRPLAMADCDALMIANWQKTVRLSDIVYFLGDFALNVPHQDYMYTLMKQLPGRLILIPGNHDHLHRWDYQNAGFSQIHGSYQYKGTWLTHMPLHPQSLGARLNIHGHTHERNIHDTRYVNVSVEQINYCPQPLDVAIARGIVHGGIDESIRPR